ncbi:MAG: hypothetical protein HY075_10355 [Deltaproteobacteria bacterium]|nr:hypothetical protein [Deltaproteobacteria bacterium]
MLNVIFAFALGAAAHAAPNAPESWYVLPEDQVAVNGLVSESDEAKKTEQAGALVDNIFAADGQALDGVPQSVENASTDPTRPKDWAPWHMEYFMTDLAISTSGTLGVLAWKGTPSVQVFWRRQNEPGRKKPDPVVIEPKPAGVVSELAVSTEATPRELSLQLEPAVKAIMASGKVSDESALRRNLAAAAQDFQSLVSVIEKDSGSAWWVSRFRLDVTIDASGKVYPFLTLGAETRFRFDWFRLKSAHPVVARPSAGPEVARLQSNLEKFVRETATDLEAVSSDPKLEQGGFKAFQFRVGVGASAKGDVGIVKATASMMGQIYFARDVKKPLVNPPRPASGYVNLIEDCVSQRHLQFASDNGIAADSSFDQVVYKIDRARFRNGVAKALGMGGFFARRASNATSKHWKIFEMRPAFDLSLTGSLGVVTVGGLASVEICFYNQNF